MAYDIMNLGGNNLKNTTRFSKNYTIKKDSQQNKIEKTKMESPISIRQQLKQVKENCIKEVVAFIKNTNSCVIPELSEE